MPSKSKIQPMFNRIADKYDLLNNLLSVGTHWLWKRRLIRLIKSEEPYSLLDGATGTGDIAILAQSFCPQILAIDFSEEMLNFARRKKSRVKFEYGDLTNLILPEKSYDVSSVSFGVRNVESLEICLSELSRVTKKKVYILEFGTPRNFLFRSIYFGVMKYIIPFIGKIFKQKEAYNYLITSSISFPSDESFLEIAKPYFKESQYYSLMGGIAYIYELKP